jgi:hypothetical protein
MSHKQQIQIVQMGTICDLLMRNWSQHIKKKLPCESHTTGKQQSLQKMCTEWEAITMHIELLHVNENFKKLKDH